MVALLRDSKRDVLQARKELGNERNCCIRIEDNFNAALESSVNKSVVDASERTHLEVEVEKEKEKEKIMEEALEVVVAKYLTSDAFGIVKADCFWEGFEEFWDITIK